VLTVGGKFPPFELTASVSHLDALRTDELCPCNWSQSDETLDPVKLSAGE